jgi:hypothetical protein
MSRTETVCVIALAAAFIAMTILVVIPVVIPH